jgi:hypothetical protein
VETILGFSALLHEVRQLSWRPVLVNQCASLKRFSKALQENQARPVQPGHNHGGPVGAEVYIRGTVVPFHHSATTLGEDHISIHQEKKHYQRDQRKNTLL